MYSSNSRENQDLIVVALFDGKECGTYLEIGSGGPIVDSNTYLLEHEFRWHGVSIDYSPIAGLQWTSRKNPFIQDDATSLDYSKVIHEYGLGNTIDFLQIDVDGTNTALNNTSFAVLESIDFTKNTFGFVTFEHNYYLDPSTKERLLSREILLDHGYTMLVSDVRHNEMLFEDWFIMESLMPNENWRSLMGDRVQMNGTPSGALKEILERIHARRNSVLA